MPKITKETRINEELERLNGFFISIDGNQRAAVTPLIQNAAFMKVTLEDLQATINADGTTDEYQNGANQYGVKQSATLQAYNSLIKNYANVIKNLAQLLPPEKKKAPMDPVQAVLSQELSPEEEARKWEEEKQQIDEQLAQRNAEIARAVEYQRKQREAEAAKI